MSVSSSRILIFLVARSGSTVSQPLGGFQLAHGDCKGEDYLLFAYFGLAVSAEPRWAPRI